MRFSLISDEWIGTGIHNVTSSLEEIGIYRFFMQQEYGSSIDGVTIILFCRPPEMKFKQRIRHVTKERKLYMDIMLDANQFVNIDPKSREKKIAEKLITEVPAIIAKYKFKDFNLLLFESHLREWMRKLIEKSHDIDTYPRPIDTQLNVSITNMRSGENATIFLSDESGTLLLTEESSFSPIQIDMTNYPDDVYSVKVVVGQDQLYRKFLKGTSKLTVKNLPSK